MEKLTLLILSFYILEPVGLSWAFQPLFFLKSSFPDPDSHLMTSPPRL